MNQPVRDKIKTLWAHYQRQMFDFAIGWSEINKPLAPFRDAAVFTVMLELAGIKFNWMEWGTIYIIISIGIIMFGKFLRRNGVVKFNNFLQNQENEMMMKIEAIEEHLKK